MTIVVLGIDALDPDLVDSDAHPNLVLNEYSPIDTIVSHTGEPSTHELWPSIITGLSPNEHGLQLDDGVAWENPLFSYGSSVADYFLPDGLQTRLGAWLLNNTNQDAFRVPASYYERHDIATVFDDHKSLPIGIPNYVLDPDKEDREHSLRRRLGDLFERNPDATGGHTSSDPDEFYELCMEMAMIRIARARRALRGGKYELIFAYTSGLDLIGHVSYDLPDIQKSSYAEFDEFVGELREDLDTDDELLLISDHGLQDGVHTEKAMVACTSSEVVDGISDVRDVRAAIEEALEQGSHEPEYREHIDQDAKRGEEVRGRLEDLGYI